MPLESSRTRLCMRMSVLLKNSAPRASITAVIFFTWCRWPGLGRRPGRRRCGGHALQFFLGQPEALDGGIHFRPFLLEEALALVLHQRLARARAHEHAQTAALFHQLLVDELLAALEHRERVQAEVRG